MFGFQHEDVVPDLVVLGKALGGGLPVSLVAGPRALLEAVPPLRQTSTFSANPVDCAAGSVVIDRLLGEQLPQRAAVLGDVLVRAVGGPDVPEVRLETIGRGLMTGVRVAAAPGNDRGAFTRSVVRRMREFGVLALRGGADGSVVKWTPPLTISENELLRSVSVLAEALTAEADAVRSNG
ncbi:aminotransferase class III-fold pyridoxal phosphate-dependent enzyme [Streptomyces sp. NBC_00076]|uniref:aminotransferase class III-fold pyridoxal phosphate-dependent enzyme n=1 Tax=Streptomyces sp. NBC_00076 TaxID=2975642 RepID=UPI003255149A